MVTSSVFSCLLCTLIAIFALTSKCASEKLPAANIVKKSTDDHENDETIEDNAESAEKRSACSKGFEDSDGDGSCSDIDECKLNNTHRCDTETTSCKNENGSYQCICIKEGYVFKNGSVTECERKDLCRVDHHYDQTVQCDNSTTTCTLNKEIGSFTCACRAGYTGLSTRNETNERVKYQLQFCSDVDECEVSSHCNVTISKCHNFPGSFSCICSQGYYNDKQNCTDIDECIGSHNCSFPSAVCNNLMGSYTCECAEGYENYTSSNDTRIVDDHEKESLDDKKIKKVTLIRSCADIDECVCPERCACAEARCIEEEPNRTKREDKSGTNSTTVVIAVNENNVGCKNTVGGYSCECHVRYPYCVKRRNGTETECRECNPYPCGSREIRGDCRGDEALACQQISGEDPCDDEAGGNETEEGRCRCERPWSDTYCDTANHTLRNVNDSETVSSPLYPSSYLRLTGLEAEEMRLRWFVNSPELPTDQQVKIQVYEMNVPCDDRVELEDVSTEQPVTYFVANCNNWLVNCNSTCITTNSTSLRLTLTRNLTQEGEGMFNLTFQRVSSDYTCPICD